MSKELGVEYNTITSLVIEELRKGEQTQFGLQKGIRESSFLAPSMTALVKVLNFMVDKDFAESRKGRDNFGHTTMLYRLKESEGMKRYKEAYPYDRTINN